MNFGKSFVRIGLGYIVYGACSVVDKDINNLKFPVCIVPGSNLLSAKLFCKK